MNHVAIDLGSKQSQICIRRPGGTVVVERRIATCTVPDYLQNQPPSRIIVETCAEAFFVADAARAAGHDVRVVPASLAKSLGVGARRTKRDRTDAQNLSEASCRMDLPSVHVPSQASRARKTLCGMREQLVGCRTALINSVRGWLRMQARAPRRGDSVTFARRVRELGDRPSYVERQLSAIEELNEHITEADQELAEIAKKDSICQRLMTVPGVGPVTAVRFCAALDERERFASAHLVESYLGLVPGEYSSGERQQRLSLTKAGPAALRWVLVQAAWCARVWRKNDPMVRWSYEVERRRGKRIAVVALARKRAGILYAVWRDGSTYDPLRGAKAEL